MRHFLIHSFHFFAFILYATSLTVAASEELDAVLINGSALEAYTPYNFIGSHQRINADQFNQAFHTIPSLLQQQSGIDINSVGGIGQYSSPTIRGSSGQQVLVFWDGLLLNGLSGGGADIGGLSLNLANTIDIYRSIAPAELSASSVGGVIHIQSGDLETNDINGTATVVRGSYNTQQYSVSQHFNTTNSKWLIASDFLKADNDYKYVQIGSVNNPNTPISVPRYNNRSDQFNTLLKGQSSFDNSRLDLAFQLGENNRELSNILNSPTNISMLSTKSSSLQMRWKQNWNTNHKSEFLTGLNHQSQLYDDQLSSVGLGAQLNEYDTVTRRVQWNHYIDYKKFSGLISARSQIEKNDTDYKLLNEAELIAQCNSGRGCEITYERQKNDISSRIQYRSDSNQIIFQASHIELSDKNLTSTKSLQSFTGTTWSIALEHKSNSGFTSFFNIANQVRLPSTPELFGDRGMSVGNPDLLPEEAKHYEIGLSYQNSVLELKSSFYIRNLQNAIIGEEDSQGVIKFSNLGTTQHIGFEQNIIWNPIHNVTISANVTIQSNEIIKDDRFASYEGNQVAGYSQFNSYLKAQWILNNWDFALSNALEREGFYVNSNLLPKDEVNQFNTSIGHNFKQWRVSLDLNDLTDNAAQDYPSYPEPGRMYFLRANTKW